MEKVLLTTYRKSGVALSENTLLWVTIAPVTLEKRHLAPKSVQYLQKATTHVGV